MPKKVTQAHIQKWRGLFAEGKDYQEIGRLTHWQARTVRKYLESDIRSSETQQIRRELFKERLGKHWDMLLEGVLGPLEHIKVPRPEEIANWVCTSTPGPSGAYFLGGTLVQRDEEWKLTVQVQARTTHHWPLLQEHMPRDPLWPEVKAWEQDLEAFLLACRRLYLSIEKGLPELSRLPVVERLAGSPALTPGFARLIFEDTLARGLGTLGWRELAQDEFVEAATGEITVRNLHDVAFARGGKAKLFQLLKRAVGVWAQSTEAAEARRTHVKLQEAAAEVARITTHLKLLPYLPGVCSVCGRFEI